MIDFSIVIPVHNEGERLEELFIHFWKDLGSIKEYLVQAHLMENGSNDNTYAVCRSLEASFPGIIFAHRMDVASYGEAVKQGIMTSSGTAVCILECDALDARFLSTSLKAIEEEDVDIVIASKRHPCSSDRRPWSRRMLTLFFNLFLRFYFRYPGTDTHGLKTMRSDIAKYLCKQSITGGEIFQTEIVMIADRLGFKIKEVPINIEEKRATKISPLKRLPKVLRIFLDLRKSLSRLPKKNINGSGTLPTSKFERAFKRNPNAKQ